MTQASRSALGMRRILAASKAFHMHRVAICAAFLSSVMLTGCERAKTKLDREVDRLCAIDGGVHIHEAVQLESAEYDPARTERSAKEKRLGRLGPKYSEAVESKRIVDGNPSLIRVRLTVTRDEDKKVIAEIIDYKRIGGDFPGPWEPSHHTCAQSTDTGRFYQKIFLKAE